MTESAAPWANEIASWAYPEISPAPIESVRSFELLLDLDAFQAVVVEPALEPVDVDLRAGLTGDRAVLGEIDVDPVGGGARLGEDDGAERDEEGDERRGEDDRDDRDREPAREPQAL